MNRITLALTVLVLGLPVLPAQAVSQRTFVSGTGDDGNTAQDCPRAAPCRTFAGAHGATGDRGEITVLDPGSYGGLTITKNISIVNDGVGEAGMLVSGGFTAITINAPGAAVTLRGLTIKGIGFGGGNGIDFKAGAALNVENCTIRNLDGPGFGIIFEPSVGNAHLAVTNSMITDNFFDGIKIAPTGSARVTAALVGLGLHSNGQAGLHVIGSAGTTAKVTLTDSASTNGGKAQGGGGGVLVQTSGNAPATALLVRTLVTNNDGFGVRADGVNASITASQTTVKSNAAGFSATGGGTILSFGENLVFDNISNPGPLNPILKQ